MPGSDIERTSQNRQSFHEMDTKNCAPGKEQLMKGPRDISDIYGRYGLWQKKLFVFVFFTSLLSAWNNLAMAFFAPDVNYWCAPPSHLQGENDTEVWLRTGVPWEEVNGHHRHSKCLMYDTMDKTTATGSNRSTIECSQWMFNNSVFHSTIVDQWNLVCKQEWLISFAQSMYMGGYMTSMLLFGQLSDRFGRRPVVLIAICIFILAGFACLQTSYFFVFTVMRFFISLGVSGAGATSFVLLMETIGPEYRSNLGLGFNYGWATGYVLLPLVAWLIPHWYFLQLAITVPSVCLLMGYWFVPESPRWLMTKMKYKRAEDLMSRAAAVNGKDVTEASKLFKQYRDQEDEFRDEGSPARATFLDLVRTPNMRKKSLNLFFCWFVNSFIYFGLSLNSNGLEGNLFINFFIAGIIEFPAYALATVVIKKMGRRNPQMAVMILGGLACFLTISVPDDLLWLRITLATLGKFCVTASFGMIYVFSAEIFPTAVRNIGIGCSSTFARIGSMVAPFVKELGRATHPVVPFAVYGGLSLVSGFLVYFLPETLGCKLPDTVDEGERFGIQTHRNKNSECADHNCQELLEDSERQMST